MISLKMWNLDKIPRFVIVIMFSVTITKGSKLNETTLDNLLDVVFEQSKPVAAFNERIIQIEEERVAAEEIEFARARSSPQKRFKNNNPARSQNRKRCGVKNFDGIRMHRTREDYVTTKFAEFSWMVSVFKKNPKNLRISYYQCGGALIHPLVIVTSAKCVFRTSPSILSIRAGDWNIERKERFYETQDREVTEIEIHENFPQDPIENNIALVILRKPFELADHIQSICLPSASYVFESTFCYLTGWGRNSLDPELKFPKVLKKLELSIFTPDVCQTKLTNVSSELGSQFSQSQNLLCAGDEDGKQNICEGDEGSPLVCRIPGTLNIYQLAGIAIWSEGCNDTDVPGIYTNIALFREWIDTKFAYRGLDSTFYVEQSIQF